MKKVLLLGALLSTMAFALNISGEGDQSNVAEIKLNGTAVEKLNITSNHDSINFGNVIAGTYAENTDVTITITGEQGNTATLTARIDGDTNNVLEVALGEGELGTTATKEDLSVNQTGATTGLKVKYSPRDASHDISGETTKIILTAVYN